MTPLSCSRVQESIVAGAAMDANDQAHAVACPACARVAAECMALEGMVVEEMNGVVVPDGFADRVMARLGDDVAVSRLDGWLGRRWVQLALAQVGLAVAIVNVVRFVLATLVPAASLGGAP